MTSLSGITPSGRLTLGNHLGALRRFTDPDGFYFVANLHAMTTKHDPRRLAALTRETATLMLAAGLPAGTVFVQSDVPAHAQLGYLLECTSYVGELSRMIQYKEKGRGKPMTRASLFTYPCLMAADILLYGANGCRSAATRTSTSSSPGISRSGSTASTARRSSYRSWPRRRWRRGSRTWRTRRRR